MFGPFEDVEDAIIVDEAYSMLFGRFGLLSEIQNDPSAALFLCVFTGPIVFGIFPWHTDRTSTSSRSITTK